jgi:hypothetical protein
MDAGVKSDEAWRVQRKEESAMEREGKEKESY